MKKILLITIIFSFSAYAMKSEGEKSTRRVAFLKACADGTVCFHGRNVQFGPYEIDKKDVGSFASSAVARLRRAANGEGNSFEGLSEVDAYYVNELCNFFELYPKQEALEDVEIVIQSQNNPLLNPALQEEIRLILQGDCAREILQQGFSKRRKEFLRIMQSKETESIIESLKKVGQLSPTMPSVYTIVLENKEAFVSSEK